MTDRAGLSTYLHYGHLPHVDPRAGERSWAQVRAGDVRRIEDVDEGALLAEGTQAFRAALRAELERAPCGARHVVPLSGGIDSRLILGELVRLGLAQRVEALTFGIPGTFDFDLAPRVARAAGVRHHAIDLSGAAPSRDALLGTLRRAPWSFVFEVAWNHAVFERFGPDATYWSGSQANSLAGEDAEERFPDWESARHAFAHAVRFTGAIDLAPPDFRPETALPERPPLTGSCLNFFQQLHLFVRNPSRNDPAQLPSGFDVRTPFHRMEWAGFVLRLPPEVLRRGRRYHEIAAHAAPELFALPTKTYLGLPVHAPGWRVQVRRARLKAARGVARRFPRGVRAPNPKLNYVDFDRELREPTPLRERVLESLEALARRRCVDWLDPLALWTRHQRRAANLGEALALLASLELALAAEPHAEPVALAAP